jgi:parvulin-like peptidyl-prolyl isomerase
MNRNPSASSSQDIPERQRRRQERAFRARRVLLIIFGLALVLIVTVPAFGYYVVFVQPKQEVVIRVNDAEFTMNTLIKMARRTILQGMAVGQYDPQVTTELIIGAIGEIQHDEILRQSAPRMGITVTEEDIQWQLREMLDRPYSVELTAENRDDRTFTELYRQRLNVLRMSDEEYRNIVRADIIRSKLEEQLSVEMPKGDEQVHVLVIQTDGGEAMSEVRRRLQAGQDFASLATQFSTHRFTNGKGGDWGWFPRGVEGDFEDVWFSLQPGEISEDLQTLDGVYLFQIVDYQVYREISEAHIRRLKIRLVQDWINEQRKLNDMYQLWNQARYRYVLDELRDDPLISNQREQLEQQEQQGASSSRAVGAVSVG